MEESGVYIGINQILYVGHGSSVYKLLSGSGEIYT